MANAMNIVDVFKVLLDGGKIIRKVSAISGETEYNVMTADDAGQPDFYLGHISEEQFKELRYKGILDYELAKTDKEGNSLTPFFSVSRKKD